MEEEPATSDVAIIGGSGLTKLRNLEIVRREVVSTPHGDPSGPLIHGNVGACAAVFLARHGYGHTIPPHRVNYAANIWALHSIGARQVIAIASVGTISAHLVPGSIVIPDQIIDYTYARQQTFFETELEDVTHIDFTNPYSERLRAKLREAAETVGIEAAGEGTYAVMQGPRLETVAEINRLERDGCDIIGMTGMPEAALARELEMEYATCAVVANRAAGRGDDIYEDIEKHLASGVEQVETLLTALLPLL